MPVTVLFVTANPAASARLALKEEFAAVVDATKDGDFAQHFRFVLLEGASISALQIALDQHHPTILHFAGHGGVDELHLEHRGVTQRLTGRGLASILAATEANVGLVVLNACHSGTVARSLVDPAFAADHGAAARPGEPVFSSVRRDFVTSAEAIEAGPLPDDEEIATRVKAVIGMTRSVHDDTAREFALGFYTALVGGSSIARSFDQGKALVRALALPDAPVPQIVKPSSVDAARLTLPWMALSLPLGEPDSLPPRVPDRVVATVMPSTRPRHPTLSEWGPGLDTEPVIVRRRMRWMVAGTAIFALLAVIMSCASGAACVEVTVGHLGVTDWLVYGYVGELTHGPWALLAAPVFVICLRRFLKRADDWLEAAFKRRTLVVRDAPGQPSLDVVTWYAQLNRTWFRPITLVLALASVGVVVGGELATWNDKVFGWVQARQAPTFGPNAAETTSLAELRDEGVASLPIAREVCPWTRRACRIEAVSGGSRTSSERAWFLPFVVVALALQTWLVFFCLYASAKVVFFITVHLRALAGRGRLRFRLDVEAPDRRMGMSRLDEPIGAALLVTAMGCVWVCLGALSNNEKGSRFFITEATYNFGYIAHLLAFVVALLLLCALIVVPLVVFDSIAQDNLDHARSQLDQLYGMGTTEERRHIEHRIVVVKSQRLRPSVRATATVGGLYVAVALLIALYLSVTTTWPPVAWARQTLARDVPRGVCHAIGETDAFTP